MIKYQNIATNTVKNKALHQNSENEKKDNKQFKSMWKNYLFLKKLIKKFIEGDLRQKIIKNHPNYFNKRGQEKN